MEEAQYIIQGKPMSKKDNRFIFIFHGFFVEDGGGGEGRVMPMAVVVVVGEQRRKATEELIKSGKAMVTSATPPFSS